MTLSNIAPLFRFLAALVMFLAAGAAHAVPSFARQTGVPCASCHVTGFSELTSFGRQFKLRGYSIGESKLPLAAGAVISRTSSRNADANGGDMSFDKDRQVALQRLSVYLAGRVAEGAGGFVNWNYDAAEKRGTMEMVDLRATHGVSLAGKELLLGATLNNNPTVSDVYNSTPGFGFPHLAPAMAGVAVPNAQVQLDMTLASRVAGASVFGWWNDMLYAEFGTYRTANGVFSILRAGLPEDDRVAIRSGAPYWRLAVERQWDAHSLALGTYGLIVKRFPNQESPSGPTDRFRDLAIDLQYQYVTDEHRVGSGVTWIREKRQWNASFDASGAASTRDAPTSALRTAKAHVTYFYRKTYGASLGLLDIRGTTDYLQYGTMMPVTGSASGSPNTRALQLEASYLPVENLRLGVQYTAYRKFNGASTNYDGFGRDARDNDVLYAWAWLLY
jgi:hypothetical protein